jgi:iron complex transport system substrate-binding protein
MKIKLLLFPFCFALLFGSCTKNNRYNEQEELKTDVQSEIKHAKGFTIERFAEYTQIKVRNPWDSTRILETYILVDRNKETPANLPKGSVVKIPVQRVAICTSVFAGEYHKLGEIDKVVAVSEPQYIDLPEIKEGLKNGKIADLGITVKLNVEKLIASRVEILVISPFEESMHDRFKNNGICVVKDASYMEDSPLGRTEWLKFEAAFLGKDSLANEIFSGIEKRYLDICKKVGKIKTRPTVFTEKKFGDSWYVAGGNSYMGRFLKDAGADYIWSDLKNSGSVPFSFETVFAKALNARFWLIKYNNAQYDLNYKHLGEEYNLYKQFSAYKNRNIVAVNSATTPYYEEGPLEPDVVLSDLVSIFHPDLLPGHKAKYYFKLN